MVNASVEDATESANIALRHIWVDTISAGLWPPDIPCRWPMQYPTLHSDRLLFVGFNPSFSARALRTGDDPTLIDVGDLDNRELVQQRIAAEAHWRRPDSLYPYFVPFAEFGLPWEHIDVFGIRERDQDKVRKALGLHGDQWSPFAEGQFEVFEDLLAALRPTGIVVVSALGSTLVSMRWSQSGRLGSAEHAGKGVLRDGAREIPVFFASMLSGQRAMDRFSRARLIHEVRSAYPPESSGIGPSGGTRPRAQSVNSRILRC